MTLYSTILLNVPFTERNVAYVQTDDDAAALGIADGEKEDFYCKTIYSKNSALPSELPRSPPEWSSHLRVLLA